MASAPASAQVAAPACDLASAPVSDHVAALASALAGFALAKAGVLAAYVVNRNPGKYKLMGM